MTWYMHGLWMSGYCICGSLLMFFETRDPLWLGITMLCFAVVWKVGDALIDYVRERGCNV